MEPAKQPLKETKSSQTKPYLKYSGLAFQMIGIMSLAAFGGRKLDAHFGNEIPWCTLVLLLIAIAASMYLVVVSLKQKD